MAILVSAKSWQKATVRKARLSPDRLSPEEVSNVRRALDFLRSQQGGTEKLATALGVRPKTLAMMFTKTGKPSAGLALRTARLAGQPVEAILAGEWPREGACPHCGR
jgi:DNA-binding XRE family transcriptional regulator